MPRWSALPFVLLLACNQSHGALDDGGLDDAGADAGEPTSFDPYHLDGTTVAVSLGLDLEAGVFRHRVNLCSLTASVDGRIVEEGDALVLRPNEGSDGILWYSALASDRMVAEVRLRRAPEGLLASFEAEGETVEELWLAGGRCPDCEGDRDPFPCDDPFGG